MIVTAAHVVRDAHVWGQIITIHNVAGSASVTLLPNERGLDLHPSLDSAFVTGGLQAFVGNALPTEPIEIVPPQRIVKPGVEVGWLGFPYLVSPELCFFSGHISAVVDGRYFIDGVAIEGVSGGPAFLYRNVDPTGLYILGSISAYRPNRATGETLPGLLVADNSSWAHRLGNRTA